MSLFIPSTVAKAVRSFTLALRSLWLHKLRAFLSVLGIIIGTGAVIALMAFGEGSMHEALEDIKRLGATNNIIRGVKPPESNTTTQQRVAVYGLTYADYDLFATIDAVTRRVPMRVFFQKFRYLERKHNGRLLATLPEYAAINQLELARGRFLIPEDDEQMNNVAVLAASTADKLFPFEDPIDHSVRVGTYFYRVVGVLKERMPTGGSGGSQAAEDFNDDVYIPLKTCRVRFGDIITIRRAGSFQREQVPLHPVTLTVSNIDKVRPVGSMISDLLEERHGQKDWLVTVPLDILKAAQETQERYLILLVLIAAISLLVGGIGIMNIMLATVTERTREIGVRRALGAQRRDIITQFLIETMVLSVGGGLIGVLLGVMTPLVVSQLTAMKTVITLWSLVLAFGISGVVGIIFGLYPASRAAALHPIEALRHE